MAATFVFLLVGESNLMSESHNACTAIVLGHLLAALKPFLLSDETGAAPQYDELHGFARNARGSGLDSQSLALPTPPTPSAMLPVNLGCQVVLRQLEISYVVTATAGLGRMREKDAKSLSQHTVSTGVPSTSALCHLFAFLLPSPQP